MTAPDSRDSVLLPCPFCGNADVDVMYAGEVVYVACRGCDAEGSKWRTEKTAVKHWNNRQALARGPQQAGGEDYVEDRYCDDLLDWLWKEAGEQSAQYQAAAALMLDRRALQAEVARLNEQAEHLRRMYRNACRELALANEATLQARAALREAGRDAEDAKRWRSFRKTRSIRAEGLTPEHWDAREDAHIAAAETDAYDAALNGGQDDA